jgi:glycine oxidase
MLRYSGRMSAKQVTVVGAGIIGTSIARLLAKAGRRVRLIDARAPGTGATHAAAGMLAVGECDADSVWFRLGLRSIALYPEWVWDLEAETGLKIDFSLCGAIEKADGDNADFACRCERQRALGIHCEMRGDGAYFPGDGAVDPRSLFRALIASCRQLPVEIVENTPMERMDDEDGPVVIAAGAWSGGIPVFSGGRRLDLPGTVPVKGHLIGYSLTPGSLPHILRCGHSYIVQRANGFTIAGSTIEHVGFNDTVDEALCLEIRRDAERVWPGLERREPNEAWIGFRPLCATGEPAIGTVDGTGICLAYGHYRSGILLAPVTAEMVAESVLAL